ncbi:hypothetical protein GGR58DRAFT_140084 [Xylaria digitata]|nr:hypothetical protein GGR58DRAFT_140084 [Xylaria digitata]
MASQSASSDGDSSVDEVQQLREELNRLREYKAAAEHDLEQMGLDLRAARNQSWVSKRAELRRRKLEKKKAAEAAKWAEVDSNRQWLREQRKSVGLPVNDPTPSPSEAAYRERVAEAKEKATAEKLRNRVRRVSHQLLIAATIGKLYREVTTADHSGYNVPGADPAAVLEHRPFDARSDTSLSTTEAMARSFRNWANREKRNRFRARSRSPSTVVASSRTTGPEDTPSGSPSDSSFTDDSAPAAGVLGALALMYGLGAPDEDDANSGDDDDDDGDELSSLSSLVFSVISDKTNAAAGNTPSTYQPFADAGKEIADKIAGQLTDILSSTDLDKFEQELKEKFKFFQTPSKGKGAAKGKPPKKSGFPTWYEMNHGLKSENEAEEASQEQNAKAGSKHTKRDKKRKGRRSGYRRRPIRLPNRPAEPDRSVWDPTWWRVNTKDADDGVWAGKAAGQKQPKDKMETGFVKWTEQEKRFPHLNERLRLKEIRRVNPTAQGWNPIIFDPATADTHAWDPLNRAITEPKTGKREPLRLNPVTVHSLARWPKYNYLPSKDPVQMPDNPPVEVKKRPISSVTFSNAGAAKKKKTTGWSPGSGLLGGAKGKGKKVTFADVGPSAAVASVYYPLKSPIAQSFSKSQLDSQQDVQTYISPPTPYPDTPTVALYQHDEAYFPGEDGAAATQEAVSEEQEQDTKLATFLQGLRDGNGSEDASKNDNGKRPAPFAFVAPPISTRRKTGIGGASDSEKENTVKAPSTIDVTKKGDLKLRLTEEYADEELQTAHPSFVSEYQAARAAVDHSPTTSAHRAATARLEAAQSRLKAVLKEETAQKKSWLARRGPLFSSLAKPRSASSGEKKSVRFDIQREGPSGGMMRGAQRAIGRYGATSSRRGPFR